MSNSACSEEQCLQNLYWDGHKVLCLMKELLTLIYSIFSTTKYVNIREGRNRSIVSRIKFTPMFIHRDYPNMFTFDGQIPYINPFGVQKIPGIYLVHYYFIEISRTIYMGMEN